MLKDLKPELGAVVWDEGLPEKRMALQPEYKQQRAAMPEKMIPQLDYIQRLCGPMGFASIAKSGTEADDLMPVIRWKPIAKELRRFSPRMTKTSSNW